MSVLFKILKVILVIGVVGLLLWGAWLVVSRYYGPLLFWGWLFFSVLASLYLFVSVLSLYFGKIDSSRDALALARMVDQIGRGRWQRTRLRLGELFNAIGNGILWPFWLWQIARVQGEVGDSNPRTRGTAKGVLEIPDLRAAVMLLVLVLGVIAATWGGIMSWHTRGFLLLLLAIPSFKMAAGVTLGASTAKRFRISLTQPYVGFALLTVCYGGSLVLGRAALEGSEAGVAPDLTVLYQAALDIFQLGAAWSVWEGSRKLVDLFFGVASLLFYVSLVGSISNWKKFRRTSDDFHAIASSLLFLERFNDALSWLQRVSAPTATTFRLKAAALLGVNRVPEALEALEKSLSMADEASGHLQPHLSACDLVAAFPIPPHVVTKLLDDWLQREPEPDQLLGGLFCITPTVIEKESIAQRFAEDPRLDALPVHRAWFHLLLGRTEETRRLLSGPVPSEADELIQLLLLPGLEITPDTTLEEDRQVMERWMDRRLRRIGELVSVCPWPALMGAIGLFQHVRQTIGQLSPTRLQEVLYYESLIRRRLEDEVGGQPLAMIDSVTERLES